jgi:hypothetical protein
MDNPMKRKRGRPFGSIVEPGKKDGRPRFIPTDDQKFLVTMMSSTGVPHERQAKAIGVNSKTLRKYFKEELQLGRNRAHAEIAGALYKRALDGNVPAQIFYLKTQAGWREAQRLELRAEGQDFITETERHQRLAAILQTKPKLLEHSV